MNEERNDNLPAKKVDKPIVSGKVRKKSEISKLSDVFLADDVGSVGRFIVSDVIIPTIKNLFYDVVDNSLKMALFGERGGRTTRQHKRSGEYVSYDKMSRRDDRDYPDDRVRARHRYNDIEYDSRGEAEMVLEQMEDIIDRYGHVSVADLYDLADVTGEYTDHKYGWTNLRSAEIMRNRYGAYVIKFPKAMPLNR